MNRLAERAGALRLPRHTVRLRLTLLYGTLFLVSGAGLLTITYVLVARQYSGNFFIVSANTAGAGGGVAVGTQEPAMFETAASLPPEPEEMIAQARNQTNAALHTLLMQSGLALAIMAVISICLGWLVAGRALRPLRTITNAARDISASNLHRRLALDGPDDELKQLGTTFNGLLERLEASFDAQRQFVANASHELRTPLTLERTLVEVALADPDATVESLRETCRRVVAAGEQQERLIEALLTLSRSQRGLDQREPFDLAAVTREILCEHRPEAERRGLGIDTRLAPALASGDLRLGERLVANLVDNAIRHNVPGGWIEISTATAGACATISVANTGPIIPPPEIERLLRPFQRLAADRGAESDDHGLGLGLSIAHAIAAAHGATLVVRARSGGGLEITASFPASHERLTLPGAHPAAAVAAQAVGSPSSQRAPRA